MTTDVFDRAAPKKATNVSVNSDLLRQAREMGVNLSQALEKRLEEIVRQEARQRWREENREAIEAFNRRMEKQGSALDKYRAF